MPVSLLRESRVAQQLWGPETAQLPGFDSFWSPVSRVTLAASPVPCFLESGNHLLSQQRPLSLGLDFP